jgi:hypothetical protein
MYTFKQGVMQILSYSTPRQLQKKRKKYSILHQSERKNEEKNPVVDGSLFADCSLCGFEMMLLHLNLLDLTRPRCNRYVQTFIFLVLFDLDLNDI